MAAQFYLLVRSSLRTGGRDPARSRDVNSWSLRHGCVRSILCVSARMAGPLLAPALSSAALTDVGKISRH